MERLRLAREVIGDAELYADANGAHNAKQAVRIAGQAPGLRWLEEPVPSGDPAGLRIVREAFSCEVAAGEYGYHLLPQPVRDLLRAFAQRPKRCR